MSKKLTITENFEALISKYADVFTEGEIAFLKDRAEKAAKKNSSRKPNKTQVANEGIKADILNAMESGKAYTVGEIQKAVGLETNQKTSALLRQLKETGAVVRSESKGRAYFTKAD